jgi:hypothetical protein
MKTKQRTEITFETHELTIIRFRHRAATAYCVQCRAETMHLSAAQSVSILPLTEAEIFHLTETGQIHSTENADGLLLLCGNSLASFKQA